MDRDQGSHHQPNSRASTYDQPTISPHTINELVSTARGIMSEYVSALRCIPPEVIVGCRGERHAYSRNFLKSTGYNSATNKFLSRFARPEDYTETSFLGIRYMASPNVNIFATFYPRCHHVAPDVGQPSLANNVPANAAERGTEALVSVGKDGWDGLMDNVAYLEVVLTKRTW
ncbi:hypothetical protein BJ138DRAFT_289356 [Hygrophoropsis aurantiaca]|uniref:Uncharacterized protein n=1 Tax=Hygrophoropsis aurantiaca TaxID=72124 RepID=A0ACB8AUT0_9AGAM|nr:hypothetical protein BJ138DRAFT_289356 [Hygrophoropsis aurantiaca]